MKTGHKIFAGVWLALTLAFFASLFVGPPWEAHAQGLATNSFAVSPSVTLTQCEANAISGYTNYCSLGAGELYTCLSTTTTCGTSQTGWICIAGCATTTPTGAVLVINGVSPGTTGTITLTCTLPSTAISASPGFTSTTTTLTSTISGSVPATTVPCTAKGS